MLPSTPTPFEARTPRPFAHAARRRPARGKWSPPTIVTVSPWLLSRCFCLRTAPPGAWSSCLYMPRGRGVGVGRAELTWGGGSAPAARSSATPPSGPRTAASLRCRRHRSSWARGGAVQLIIPGEKGIGGGGGGNVPAPPAEAGGSRKQRRRALRREAVELRARHTAAPDLSPSGLCATRLAICHRDAQTFKPVWA